MTLYKLLISLLFVLFVSNTYASYDYTVVFCEHKKLEGVCVDFKGPTDIPDIHKINTDFTTFFSFNVFDKSYGVMVYRGINYTDKILETEYIPYLKYGYIICNNTKNGIRSLKITKL